MANSKPSADVNFFRMKKLAPQAGLEPATLRLTAGCSAIELLRNDGGTLTGQRRPPIVTDARTSRNLQPIIRGVKKLLCLALLVAAPATAQTTIYEGATLIPGDGTPPIERSAFVEIGR